MPASIAETMRFSGCYASMFERTRFTDARAAPDESARSAPRTCVFVFSLGHELLSKKGCVFVTSGLPSSQRTSARCSRVVRMAGHGNANPVLTRMPSLADWQMHAAGDVAAVLAAAREQTEKVAGDLTAAAAAPSAGVAENRETVEACAERGLQWAPGLHDSVQPTEGLKRSARDRAVLKTMGPAAARKGGDQR